MTHKKTMLRKAVWTCSIAFLLSIASLASGESLWGAGSSLYSSEKAKRVGDSLTVVIKEKAQAEQKKNVQKGKALGFDASTSGDALGFLGTLLPLTTGAKTDFKDDDKTSSSGSFEAQVTVKVVKTYPNGDLLLEGEKKLRINNDVQHIRVSGVANPRDIDYNNTVLSTRLADPRIEVLSKVELGDKKEPGIITQTLSAIFDWLF